MRGEIVRATRRLSWGPAILLGVLLVAVIPLHQASAQVPADPSLAATSEPAICQAADLLRESGDVADALSTYINAVENADTTVHACAVQGLESLAGGGTP